MSLAKAQQHRPLPVPEMSLGDCEKVRTPAPNQRRVDISIDVDWSQKMSFAKVRKHLGARALTWCSISNHVMYALGLPMVVSDGIHFRSKTSLLGPTDMQ